MMLTRDRRLMILAVVSAIACTPSRESVDTTKAVSGTLTVYNAGSLARPLRMALDTFAVHNGLTINQENAGSLETARKLTELGKIPDVIALADFEVFPQLLMPNHVKWYAQFARNRLVIAYTDKSKYAREITPENWREILLRPGLAVGRSDPHLDPAGYRTRLAMQLAERHYKEPGLADRLLRAAPETNVRPKEADLVALVQAGELDYIWQYQSISEATGLKYVTLPHEVDLSTPEDSAIYATAHLRVRGRTPSDSVEFRGAPIVYGLSIPERAPNRLAAENFLQWLFTDEGRAIMRANKLDVLDRVVIVGEGAPASLTVGGTGAAR
jgi:molybdate/tungstate transport system substrate-binding protein